MGEGGEATMKESQFTGHTIPMYKTRWQEKDTGIQSGWVF